MSVPAPKIEMLPVSVLRPYRRNARQHSKKQVRQIADSIRRFGFTNPVLISDDEEIIAGHGRAMAAKELGLATVPTVRLSHLTADERRAYVLADNKLALKRGWDMEILATELQEKTTRFRDAFIVQSVLDERIYPKSKSDVPDDRASTALMLAFQVEHLLFKKYRLTELERY